MPLDLFRQLVQLRVGGIALIGAYIALLSGTDLCIRTRLPSILQNHAGLSWVGW